MGKQSSRLIYQGKDIKDLVYQGNYLNAMYKGKRLVWAKLAPTDAYVFAVNGVLQIMDLDFINSPHYFNGQQIYGFNLRNVPLQTTGAFSLNRFGGIQDRYQTYNYVLLSRPNETVFKHIPVEENYISYIEILGNNLYVFCSESSGGKLTIKKYELDKENNVVSKSAIYDGERNSLRLYSKNIRHDFSHKKVIFSDNGKLYGINEDGRIFVVSDLIGEPIYVFGEDVFYYRYTAERYASHGRDTYFKVTGSFLYKNNLIVSENCGNFNGNIFENDNAPILDGIVKGDDDTYYIYIRCGNYTFQNNSLANVKKEIDCKVETTRDFLNYKEIGKLTPLIINEIEGKTICFYYGFGVNVALPQADYYANISQDIGIQHHFMRLKNGNPMNADGLLITANSSYYNVDFLLRENIGFNKKED